MEDKTVQVELTVEERELIFEHVMLFHPGLEEKLHKKRSRSGYVRLELNASELDDLIGCIAREANETKDRWLENGVAGGFRSTGRCTVLASVHKSLGSVPESSRGLNTYL